MWMIYSEWLRFSEWIDEKLDMLDHLNVTRLVMIDYSEMNNVDDAKKVI